MTCCDNLIHPFQNDPGTSQRQRIVDDLLAGSAKIDGRTMAELLQYFTLLSRHITYYDNALNPGDWQAFFSKSIPFTLAGMVRYNKGAVQEKFERYNQLFLKRPNKQALQLVVHFMYNQLIAPVNAWHKTVKGSELPVEGVIEKLIGDTMADQVRKFICLSNVAVQRFHCARIELGALRENEAWHFTAKDLVQTQCFQPTAPTRRKQMIELHAVLTGLFSGLVNVIELSGKAAELSLEKSLFPLKEEFQKLHAPHLALIFAFLKLFQHLQQDLNGITKKHLDFFYQDVLKLMPKAAVPDKAYLLFQIQKQLDKYRLKKDTEVQGDKDDNKADINFALEDELVVNKTEVIDVRTLFLNHQRVYDSTNQDYNRYIEGLYVAANARKADGKEKDFPEDGPKNWATFGDKLSKYFDAESKSMKPYPNARVGFILGSPVLYLQEGVRTITISLACSLSDPCAIKAEPTRRSRCCEEQNPADDGSAPDNETVPDKDVPTDAVLNTSMLTAFNEMLQTTYFYISKDIIAQAIKLGVDKIIVDKLYSFLRQSGELCYCPAITYAYDTLVSKDKLVMPEGNVVSIPEDTYPKMLTPEEFDSLAEVLKPMHAFDIKLSGEKAWVAPEQASIGIANVNGQEFTLQITLTLKAEQPAITFFNKETLKEDYGTTDPVAKIELNDHVKFEKVAFPSLFPGQEDDPCCLATKASLEEEMSLYQFFRRVTLRQPGTTIGVKVCGVKNFIVQNDQNVMDIKGTIYPFGAQPDIVDFSIHHPASVMSQNPDYRPPNMVPNPNLRGSNFYIGSKEIFFKAWDSVCVRMNWKDKPVSFNEYYKAYLKRIIPDPVNLGDFIEVSGLDEADFQVNLSLLEEGLWQKELPSVKAPVNALTNDNNRRLFSQENCGPDCADQNANFSHSFFIEHTDFSNSKTFADLTQDVTAFDKANSRQGFVRLNLQNQDFFHRDYAFVLARQMMALGKFPDKGLEGAVYYTAGNSVIVFSDTGQRIVSLATDIKEAAAKATLTKDNVDRLDADIQAARNNTSAKNISNAEFNAGNPSIKKSLEDAVSNADDASAAANASNIKLEELKKNLSIFDFIFNNDGTLKEDLSVPIPAEPWTPILENMSIDYSATATTQDMSLIHLHAFDQTYQQIALQGTPTLLPTYCDEGTLYIGLKGLVPGGNLNLLFKLAEATANSEFRKETVAWHYLDNNTWKPLREGFEVVRDGTNGFTATGIVTLALPQNMTLENTILPKGLHWIKAAVVRNSKATSETIDLHPNAVGTIFTNRSDNDTLRLRAPLPAESLSKLKIADANIKVVNQPYASFGGHEPEVAQHFYVRASEQLRHKGRAIQKWDYERITLEGFPAIYKAKCINHSYALNASEYKNDFPAAPGYVLIAVIPDLTQMDAGHAFEPKVPVSVLDAIAKHLKARTSPFVRVQVMNPRYEKIRFCLKVKLYKGKDENYYKEKLEQDLRRFLAPWSVGEYSKIGFGQCVNRSDLLRFLEDLDYVDYILDLKMQHEADQEPIDSTVQEVCPHTPRSILLAGDIDICIAPEACEAWDRQKRCAHEPERIFLNRLTLM